MPELIGVGIPIGIGIENVKIIIPPPMISAAFPFQ
jgi:hypothetical protein